MIIIGEKFGYCYCEGLTLFWLLVFFIGVGIVFIGVLDV